MTTNMFDWRKVSYITLPLFVVLSIGAFFAFTYSEEAILGNLGVVHETIYPYQPYGFVFAVCCFILALRAVWLYLRSK
jgi:hypothetical protein